MSKTINIDLPDRFWEPLRMIGIGRDAGNPKCLSIYMSREFSDRDMRHLHEAISKAIREMLDTKE